MLVVCGINKTQFSKKSNTTYAKLAPGTLQNKNIKEIMRYTGTPDIPKISSVIE